MRFKTSPKDNAYDLPMTSMIDVIFQLLIFFMCSIHFKSLEGKLISHLPRDAGINQREPKNWIIPEEVRIKLTYDRTAQPFTKIMIGQQEIQDWTVLYQKMKADHEYFRNKFGPDYWLDEPAKEKKARIVFKLDAEGKVPFQSLVTTLSTCKEAGVQGIQLVAKTPIDESIR